MHEYIIQQPLLRHIALEVKLWMESSEEAFICNNLQFMQ